MRAAADDIRTAGTAALTELRDLVGVLAGHRDPEAPVAHPPARPATTAPDPATPVEEAEASR